MTRCAARAIIRSAWRDRSWLSCVIVALLGEMACAPGPIRLPEGPGTPVTNGSQIFATATSSCRDVRTVTAEIRLTGRVNDQRVRARLHVGLARPAAMRLEAVAPFGGPVLLFVARDGNARLWLPRDQRALTDVPPSTVLEMLVGLKLDVPELLALLTACVLPQADVVGAARYGSPERPQWCRVDLRNPSGQSATVYLRQEQSHFRIVAAILGSLRAEYGYSTDVNMSRVTSLRLHSPAALRSDATATVDLRLLLAQVDVNIPLEDSTFRLEVPPGTQPMTLDELRRVGPLGVSSPAH